MTQGQRLFFVLLLLSSFIEVHCCNQVATGHWFYSEDDLMPIGRPSSTLQNRTAMNPNKLISSRIIAAIISNVRASVYTNSPCSIRLRMRRCWTTAASSPKTPEGDKRFSKNPCPIDGIKNSFWADLFQVVIKLPMPNPKATR